MKQERRTESEGILGHLTSHRIQVKESKVMGNVVRGRSQSPREGKTIVTIVGEKKFGSTVRLKIIQ